MKGEDELPLEQILDNSPYPFYRDHINAVVRGICESYDPQALSDPWILVV